MINSDLQTKHSYKIVCRYKESLVTIDFVLPFQWNDEFYCYEPKTINSRQDDKERVYIELNFNTKQRKIFQNLNLNNCSIIIKPTN